MAVRKVRNRVNNASLSAAQAALKAAINNSLRAYMNNPVSPANLAKVNNATKNLIKVYVENAAANGNGGNTPRNNGNRPPLALTNGNKPLLLSNKPLLLSNKPHNNGNGNGGNQSRAIVPVGNVTPLGPNMKAPLANRGANEKPREPTAVNLNRLRGIAKNGASTNNAILKNQTNFVNALTRNFPNHPNVKAAKNVLNARRVAKNITAGAIAGAIKGNNVNPLGVGNLVNNGKTPVNRNKYTGITTKLNTMKEPNAQTYLSLNALKRAVKSNANSNAKAAMLQKIANKKANLDRIRVSRNVAANAAEAERAARAAKNAEAAANAERKAREAANKAAANAREANEAAKKIAANAIASVVEKQKAANAKAAANKAAANAKAAANKAAANAKAAANKAAAIKSKWQRAGQGVGKAVQAGNAFSAAGANFRRQKLLNEAKRQEAMNAAHANFMRQINNANTSERLNTIVSNIARNGKNFNSQKKSNLVGKVAIKRKQFSIRQKITDGQAKRNARTSARAANVNMNRGMMNKYGNFRRDINSAPSNKELTRLEQQLASKKNRTGTFTESERTNAKAAINRKRLNLKGQGSPSNVTGGVQAINRMSLAELNDFIRKTGARIKAGNPRPQNVTRLARATELANALRPKKRGLLGLAAHVGGGALHYAGKGAKFGLGVVTSGIGRMGQSHTFNVTVGAGRSKKIPNTPLNNGKKKPGKLERAVEFNERVAKVRRREWNGGNESERPVSAAGALGALAIAGGAHTAARAAAALKRASNLKKAANTGMYTAKTLKKYAPRIR